MEIRLLQASITEVSNETKRLEKFTDRLLAKLSSVITLSTIITFLSFASLPGGTDLSLIKYYLTWVMPFLLIAILIWILILKSSAAITMKQMSIFESDNEQATREYLEGRFEIYHGIFRATDEIYQKTRKLFGFSLGLIVAYLFNYILTFYLFIFLVLPSITEAFLISFIFLMCVYIFQDWYRKPVVAIQVSKDIKVNQESPVSPKQ